jgi:hypothetical protein
LIAVTILASAVACHAADLPEKSNPRAFDAEAYERALTRIETRRRELSRRYRKAKTKEARAALRAEARGLVIRTITRTVFPAWMGTPWGLGRNSTATRPHQPGMVVGCSYFVTSVLQNAGLRLSNRYRFARAPALQIQRSLATDPRHLHRYGSIAPEALAKRLRKLGDGLYVIGLNIHVGFVVVRGGQVRVVHASYTPPRTVVDEQLDESAAIENSRPQGYFVSSLFRDDRLVEHWLEGKPVPFLY